ncbi:uncharacterized protein LOC111785194 isoform X2 [Cucurbita pepo subsp. pepo]|uniref:uncharacterized protein LOC111785194 isoform X2 n=1 Tax=Cucurbita pepo subsp. pepo TaxID=3664 RepID=UPI000C9D370E|nr:uncharacterized protein LOC111785194 isoform X2 [Cucurbita pepo subsp. pepo]
MSILREWSMCIQKDSCRGIKPSFPLASWTLNKLDFVMAENVCLEVKYTMEEEPVKLLGMRLSRLDVIMIVGGSRLFLTMDGHFTFLPCIIPKDFSEITEEVSVCSGDSIQSAIFFSTAPRDSDSLFLFLKI